MYSIPSEEEIIEAARRVFERCSRVETQKGLAELILEELDNDEYRLSGRRAKSIVLDAGIAELEVEYREMSSKGTPRKCPVCSGKVKPLKNKTIFDGTVTLGFECVSCGYWSGLHKRVPALYVFKRR